MSIENVGSMNNLLSNYNSRDWVKSADLEIAQPFKPEVLDPGKLDSVAPTKTFGEVLAQSIGEVNRLQEDANLAMQKLATGKSKNLHETMLAVERADIAFRTMNQVRLKVIDAYREVMKMQV
ncbi:MAG: flagellar hook-basal body complex protein FliE [Bdellovibrionales bacterium]|jgi:flagellar hook-basal body complex protein FliE|nr:flagellar hook-basal body complex protein FliE [Bdellovibrionales bacterium]MBT3527427.1 flagellar hook-basal body complex protein FliE [Bdellovibrionales bacterium]MBT7668655.1 flagellar hook-basal body complex protein FliE [Bdellovibrionales bacterium]MBT7766932.1 flagellar hook-basal body complex protein FliE [Bdellovibrionales bacterium]